jgi:hypothetical protein
LDVATCKDVDTNSTWVVDLTFKINLYSVPLFGVVCPNKKDIGTPLPKELRGSTKIPHQQLQKTQKISEKYMEDPSQVLREVNILFGLLFEEDLCYTKIHGI